MEIKFSFMRRYLENYVNIQINNRKFKIEKNRKLE